MIDQGYITSRDEFVNRKLRVYYHIEESGKEYLNQLIEEYSLWEEKIDKILKMRGKIHE